jgi:hypothetical protein
MPIFKKDTSASSMFREKLKSTFQKIHQHILDLNKDRECIEKADFNKGLIFSKESLDDYDWDIVKKHMEALTKSMNFFTRQFSASNQMKDILRQFVPSSEDQMSWVNFAFFVAETFGTPEDEEKEEEKIILQKPDQPLMHYAIFKELNNDDCFSITEDTYAIPTELIPKWSEYKSKMLKTNKEMLEEEVKIKYKDIKKGVVEEACKKGYIAKWGAFKKKNADFFKKSQISASTTWKHYKSTWKILTGLKKWKKRETEISSESLEESE